MVNIAQWQALTEFCNQHAATLIAVSKTKPEQDIIDLYELGQRDFGENYVQELVEKQAHLPKDIRWHFIGHLQSNKVKYIAPFVHLIHGVDNAKLLIEIAKQAAKNERTISVLLQIHIAQEDTKFGFSPSEVEVLVKELQNTPIQNIRICGLMGMASNTDSIYQISNEFKTIDNLFKALKEQYFAHEDSFNTCSMGMSGDYELAIQCGSNMVRIGSLLFGQRTYS